MKHKKILYLFIFAASFTILLLTYSPRNLRGASVSIMEGNKTYISKPGYPVKINASQILIGSSWTFIYPLNKGSFYHVYFIGDWIGSKTDYDVYVYNPEGKLEAVHTASSGLPEHLGNKPNDPFFTPKRTGLHYFLIYNDPKESNSEDAATLMVIEHLECNRWYEKYIRGKVNFKDVHETRWAYEFASNSDRIEVIIEVPETLDMYEARLYLLANPSKGIGDILDGYPVAWEPGLYGEIDSSGHYGGYNWEDEGYRNLDAMASCEFFGQDMLINYTSPSPGETILYHLVLIGENGEGIVRFMIKTDFNPPSISLMATPKEIASGRKVAIKAKIYDEDSLKSVRLYYTNDDWASSHSVEMKETSDGIYVGVIPEYPGGNKIKYKVVAVDMVGNTAEATGSYVVKNKTELSINLSRRKIYIGEEIIITGQMSHGRDSILLNFTSQGENLLKSIMVDVNGSFNYKYTPNAIGEWTVIATYPGNKAYFEASAKETFRVEKIPTSIEIALSNDTINIGEKIDVIGNIDPPVRGKKVEILFTLPNGTVIKKETNTDSHGRFNISFTPPTTGNVSIQALLKGDNAYLPSTSKKKELIVNNTWINMILTLLSQFMLYIVMAIGGTISAVAFLIYWRRRREYL